MKFVSLEKSRAGWQPDDAPKKRPEKATPKTPTSPVASTNPDDGVSVSKHEED